MRTRFEKDMKLPALARKVSALMIVLTLLAAGCSGQPPQADEAAETAGVTEAAETTAAPEATTAPATEAATEIQAFEVQETHPTAASEALPALKLPETGAAAQGLPAVEWSAEPPCEEIDCGSLMITQEGQPQRAAVGEQGITAPARPNPLPADLSEDGRWIIDTGQPSPDGRWVAYTSIGYESGGPVFVQNVESGAWSNLLADANRRLGSQAALPVDYWWDVIGWFPDSQRLMVGPGDASMVAVIELLSSSARVIPFDGGGRGGRLFVNLAADGERFVFTGQDAEGRQTFNEYDLRSGEVTTLYALPYAEGYISNPRYAPDGETIAFVTQQGPMGSSAEDTLNLLPAGSDKPEALVEGSLWMAVPAWSPEGDRLAFAMAEDAVPALAAEAAGDAEQGIMAAELPVPRGNVWVVTLDGAAEQVTFVDGLARSPVWSGDGRTLAFVTHDGQVGLADADRPGSIWQAAPPAGQSPELISAFFLP